MKVCIKCLILDNQHIGQTLETISLLLNSIALFAKYFIIILSMQMHSDILSYTHWPAGEKIVTFIYRSLPEIA